MNMDESPGGSSCNGQENGDGFNGSERPRKKARFAWQVKGKYHLKNEDNDPAKISATECTAPETAGPSGSGSNSSNSDNIGTEQDIKTMGGYLLNQNFDVLNSVDDDPSKSDLKPRKTTLWSIQNSLNNIFTPNGTLYAQEILNHTRNFIAEDTAEFNILHPIDPQIGSSEGPLSSYMFPTDDNNDDLESAPISMVASENYTEDQCIERWQARQLAKGPIDNLINRVLDYMKDNPLGEGDPTREVQDVAELVNNLPGNGGNSIENEGILMAISAHGLQNTSNSSSSFNSISSSINQDLNEICLPGTSSLGLGFLPIHSEDESSEGEFEYALDKVQWPYSDDLKNEDNETIETPTFQGSSSLSIQNLYENLHNIEAASNDVANENVNHHHFLDAAVLFAIQSKGLANSPHILNFKL